jgi:pimeloyl-ACP methyl ester carboxylesterase
MKYFTVPSEDRLLDANRDGLRGSFVELSDGITHYELRGPSAGPLVILVPGLTIPLFYWDAVAEQLHTRGLRTLAFSAYGRGYSDRVTTTYDETLFGRQLHELITTLNVPTHQHIVGTSMGALIAMRYVAQHRESVATLTLVGPAGLSGTNARQQRVLSNNVLATLVAKRLGRRILLGHLGHNVADPEMAAPLSAMIADTYRYQGSMYGFFSTLQNFPLSNRAPLYRSTGETGIPTMLMWGTDDQVTPVTGMHVARDLLHPVQAHVVRCGHMAPFERPTNVADHLATFITSHPERITS